MAYQAFLTNQANMRKAQYLPPPPPSRDVILVQDNMIALEDDTKPKRKPKIDTTDMEGDEIIEHIISEKPPTTKVRKLMKQYVSDLDEY